MGATPTHELDRIRPRTEGCRAARAEAGLETFSSCPSFLAPLLVPKASRAHPVLSPIFQFRVSGLFRTPSLFSAIMIIVYVLSSLSSISMVSAIIIIVPYPDGACLRLQKKKGGETGEKENIASSTCSITY